MSDTSKTASDPFSAFAKFTPASTEAFQEAVQELIEESQKTAGDWMQHRQEAADAAARSLQSIWSCKDPGALARTWSDWLTKNTELAASEMRYAQEQAFRWVETGQRFVKSAFQPSSEPAEATSPKPVVRRQSAQARSAAE